MREAGRAKQSQFASLEGVGEDARPTKRRGAIVRNKANFGQPSRHEPVGCAKQSQFRGSDRTDKYWADKELWRIEHAPGPGETKPILRLWIADFGLRIGDRPALRAIPLYCGERNVRNKPNFHPPYQWMQLRQTNPIQPCWQAGRASGGAILRNKADFQRGRSCETKPIARSGAPRQCPCVRPTDGPGIHPRMPATPNAGANSLSS